MFLCRKGSEFMLIVTRKEKDSIIIETESGKIEITVVELGRQVRIGVSAPDDCKIWRGELYETIEENKQATAGLPAKDLLDSLKKMH